MKDRAQSHRFQGQMLKTARVARGITLEDLAKELEMSHQSISKYENDKATPDLETTKRIAKLLKFNPSFFYAKNEAVLVPESSHFFRSGAAVANKYKEQVQEKVHILAYLVEMIETNVKLPQFKIPDFIEVQSYFRQIDFAEIDVIAEKMRKSIGIGNGPISNITALCERLGIIISFVPMNNEKIDACTVFYNNKPYIMLNEEKFSSVRLRFNIAHELGHILLHSMYLSKDVNDKSKHKRIEQEANRFASAFLMPESTLVPELSSSGLDYLLILKEHWKVSVQAIIYRAEELGVYSDYYALYLRQQISRKKWRLQEPLDDVIPIEKPTLLKQAIKLLVNKQSISLEELSFQSGLEIEELLNMSDTEDDFIANLIVTDKNNIIHFPSKYA